jgi:maleate cis-trans isomerase
MYGWRARIGLLIADSNTTMEPEFNRLAPDGVSIHTARVRVGGITVEGLNKTDQEAAAAASLLANINAKVMAYACTAANMAAGADSDLVQARLISEAAGCPTVTASAALVEALDALKARRIAVATPYPDDLNASTSAFWKASGFDVVKIAGVDLGGARAPLLPLSSRPVSHVGLQNPSTAYNLARMAYQKGAEVLVLSGANLRTIEVIEALERDFGIPCVSSSTAVIWASLQATGVTDSIPGHGKLLREQPPLGWKRAHRHR